MILSIDSGDEEKFCLAEDALSLILSVDIFDFLILPRFMPFPRFPMPFLEEELVLNLDVEEDLRRGKAWSPSTDEFVLLGFVTEDFIEFETRMSPCCISWSKEKLIFAWDDLVEEYDFVEGNFDPPE